MTAIPVLNPTTFSDFWIIVDTGSFLTWARNAQSKVTYSFGTCFRKLLNSAS